MIPTVGRIVLYTLTEQDAAAINRRRTTGKAIADRMAQEPPEWPAGAQAHIGNTVKQGDTFPMIITRTWGSDIYSAVNGTVMLDGSDTFWVTSRTVDIPTDDGAPICGMYRWPPRVEQPLVHQEPVHTLTEQQIKHMVDRFLGWRLPKNFHPDGGVSFKRFWNEGTPGQGRHEPSGTNLLDGIQAEAMVRHMLDGMPAA